MFLSESPWSPVATINDFDDQSLIISFDTEQQCAETNSDRIDSLGFTDRKQS